MNHSQLPVDGGHSIQWCLLSHTNIGKTTLTRTLMADDVGEVEDAAHVTGRPQRYLLEQTPQGDELWLWDTPGFGDSTRLYERLGQQGNPLGWFLSHVWDRWRDKPFYLSQRALLAARDHADVMLYLVNAAEDPADAGYWSAEMQILAWLDKPVIVLLNQIGSDTTPEQTQQDLQRWKQATQGFQAVREVLVLDAFTRSWWHERRMMQSIAPLLPQAKRPAYQRLLERRAAQQQ
ncbi:MAG: 50S ribosome-binding GTPase, partial [Comamonas sp.]|nr:50S ribosome-binding GTPase [Comamonas sp.]